MTLPQRSAAIKAIVLPLLLVFSAFAAPVAAEEDENRLTLFSCGTDAADDNGWLDLNGIEREVGKWTDLRFERRANGSGDLVYSFPPDGVEAKTAFLFSHSDGPGGYLVSIRWADQGTNYVYYSLYVPPDSGLEDDVSGGTAGLAISRDGKLIERVQCIERPYMFISYMREAMSCDLANPYGEAACQGDTYERTDEIDPDTIGIVP